MKRIGIIGGSGLAQLKNLKVERRVVARTPYGEPSAPLSLGSFDDLSVVFLPRHGPGHTIPPHRINYRANLWAMREMEVEQVISVAAVGGITGAMAPGVLCIPDQIIDYTWGREHTYYNDDLTHVVHADFTQPYCEALRASLIAAATAAGLTPVPSGTYGVTQGPRLESAKEIERLERDGCDVVGMTGMPEAALARELELCYATCALVVNWAAGKTDGPISMEEIDACLAEAAEKLRRLLSKVKNLT